MNLAIINYYAPGILLDMFMYYVIYSSPHLGETGMAAHSSILSWKIPQTEEPGGLQSMGSQRIRHDWVTFTFHCLEPNLRNLAQP